MVSRNQYSAWILRESTGCDRCIAQSWTSSMRLMLLCHMMILLKVTVRCAKSTVLELRGDIARLFGYLNNTAIRAPDKKGFTLALPETVNQYFCVYTDIIKSQYHSDDVVPVLHTVTVKGEHGSYVSNNFERLHYVPLNKKIFHTISMNVRDRAGDLVASEHGKVIITLHFRCSKTQYFT